MRFRRRFGFPESVSFAEVLAWAPSPAKDAFNFAEGGSAEVAHLRSVRGDGVRRCLARLLPWLLQPGQHEGFARPHGLASSQLVRVRRQPEGLEGIPGGVQAGLPFIGITAGSTMGNRSSMLRL